MDLFLDTANLEEIKEIAAWGVLRGLTTNPSLLAKEKIAVADFVAEVKKYIKGPISLEVLGETAEEMVADAKGLKEYGDNVVIKLPMTEEGLKAQALLLPQGFQTNMTLVFSANQALLAGIAGATYVSPFLGRIHDAGGDGIGLIADIKNMFRQFSLETKIISASVRTPKDVQDAAFAESDIATIPYGVFKKMVAHPMTDVGIEKFQSDWNKSGLKSL